MLQRVISGGFSGALNLGNQEGTIYDTHIQTSVLTLEQSNASPGGWARVVIVANGNAINVPPSWINLTGEDISTENGAENHLEVFYKDADTVYYINKVEGSGESIWDRINQLLTGALRLLYHGDASAGIALTNHPNADQVIGINGAAIPIDLTDYTQIRMGMRVGTLSASANSPRAYPRYSADGGSNFLPIGAETVVSGEAISLAQVGWFRTNWINLPVGAKADVLLSARCNGGDGVADPVTGIIYFEVR